ncbi:MAG: hypothetical protein AVDCRST_MAG02-2712, partial [uncultured Rubrobacteraceae bacterium]
CGRELQRQLLRPGTARRTDDRRNQRAGHTKVRHDRIGLAL